MKNKIILLKAIPLSSVFLIFSILFSFAQPGNIDPTFISAEGFVNEAGKNPAIYAIVSQPDGKFIVGGQFVSYDGNSCNQIARLNEDGTFDRTFNCGLGFNKPVRCISIQSDGKVIAGGEFTTFDGKEQNHIIRLNTDGSKDESFDVGSSFNDIVYCTVIQQDGKIIAGGKFTNYNGMWQNNIARLNKNGSIDLVFYPENGFNDVVFSLAIQKDGKVLAGGIFTVFNGSPANHIIRLNPDGRADTGFKTGAGFDNDVRVISVDVENKVIAGGYFTSYNGKLSSYLCRINENGTLDDSFKSGKGFNGSVQSIYVQNDNRIVAGGFYTSYDGQERKNLSRINPDGTLDNSFDPGKGPNGGVMAIYSRNKIVIAGSFTSYNNLPANQICRLISDPYIISVSPTSAVCAGSDLQIEFSPEGVFEDGNLFTIELSDPSGNFANPIIIGSLIGTTGNRITAVIPESASNGSAYKVRLSASKPAIKSKPYETSLEIKARVTPIIKIVSSPSEPECSGTEIVFTALPTNGGSLPLYQWRKNGSGGGNINETFSDNSLNNGDIITCVMTSNIDCPAQNNVLSNSINVKVKPLVTPSVSISASPSGKVCEGTEVKFSALVSEGGTSPFFQWRKNGAVVGGNSVFYSDASLKNGDKVVCTVKSNAECLSKSEAESQSLTMEIIPLITPSISITAIPEGKICEGTEAKFIASVTNGGNHPSFLWKKNGKVVGENKIDYSDASLKNGDVISCTVKSDALCLSKNEVESSGIEMNINPKVKPSVTISSDPTEDICTTTLVQFTAKTENAGMDPFYQWKKNGNNVGTNSMSYSDSNWKKGDEVICVIESSAKCYSEKTASSNSIEVKAKDCK